MQYVPWVQIYRISRSPFSTLFSGGGASLHFADALPLALNHSPHDATCKYFGVIVHVCRCEGLA